jgi:uncharacterized protein YfaS (alpha-2-macroglobulin family)
MTVRYSDDAQASRFAAQAYAAGAGPSAKAPLGALREIWSRHDQARSGAAAARHRPENHGRCAAHEGLKLAIAAAQDTDRWLGDYGSPLRDDALKLALLEENNCCRKCKIRC